MNNPNVMKCKHYEGDGMMIKIVGQTLWLCDKCWKKTKLQVLEQLKFETEFCE